MRHLLITQLHHIIDHRSLFLKVDIKAVNLEVMLDLVLFSGQDLCCIQITYTVLNGVCVRTFWKCVHNACPSSLDTAHLKRVRFFK